MNERARDYTKIAMGHNGAAILTISEFFGDCLDSQVLVDEVGSQLSNLSSNSNSDEIEKMLASQAKTLDAVFHQLLRRGHFSDNVDILGTCLELGLKAQKQSRQTLVALANLKRPQSTTFVKQQNVAVNQQVNNGSQVQSEEKIKKSENELLSEDHNAKLDTGRAQEAVRADFKVEAMEAVNRP